MFHISTDTVRYYDKIGLIRSYRKGEGKYRSFDLNVLGNLSTVMLFRAAGVPIEDIRLFFEKVSLAEICNGLLRTNEGISQQLCQLYRQQGILKDIYSNLRKVQSDYNEVMIQRSPDWWILSVTGENDPQKQIKAFQSILDKEETLPSFAFIMDKGDLLHGTDRYLEYCLLNEKEYHNVSYPFRHVKSCSCAYYVFFGDPGNRTLIMHAYDTIVKWIKKHNFTITGNAIERYIMGMPEAALIEIWIPIR